MRFDVPDKVKEGMMESRAAVKALAKVLHNLDGAVEPAMVVSGFFLSEIFIPPVSCYCALCAVAPRVLGQFVKTGLRILWPHFLV